MVASCTSNSVVPTLNTTTENEQNLWRWHVERMTKEKTERERMIKCQFNILGTPQCLNNELSLWKYF